jgi:hypothetical protein
MELLRTGLSSPLVLPEWQISEAEVEVEITEQAHRAVPEEVVLLF